MRPNPTVMERMRQAFGPAPAERMLEAGLAPISAATLCCLFAQVGHGLSDFLVEKKACRAVADGYGERVSALLLRHNLLLFNVRSLMHLLDAAGKSQEDRDRILEMSSFRLAWAARHIH